MSDILIRKGFPDSSVGKESACNAGDPGSIPGLGRSAGEGTGYPLQYSWASLVDQLVKNPPAMRETWVRSLGWEDARENRKATHGSILAWRIPWTWCHRVWANFIFTFVRERFEGKTWFKLGWHVSVIYLLVLFTVLETWVKENTFFFLALKLRKLWETNHNLHAWILGSSGMSSSLQPYGL